MTRRSRSSRLLGVLAAVSMLSYSVVASAQEEDDFSDDEEFMFDDLKDASSDPEPAPEEEADGAEDEESTAPEEDGLDFLDEDEDESLDAFEDSEDDDFDLFGDEEQTKTFEPGSDTPALYRAQLDKVARMGTDEELESWEIYVNDYPKTVFRSVIEERVDALMHTLYNTRISNDGSGDALNAEVPLAQGLLLENINPRTRVQAGFEWGLPNYVNLIVDYEHALTRTFSFHSGVKRRYSGWSVEPGVHWALIKSTRTNTLVTLIGDLHINTNPTFLGIRPLLAAGQRFGKLDLQVQFGPDLEFRSPLDFRLVGGANATYRASDTVGVFLETGIHMKNFSWDGGIFVFNVATFGMKFFPGANKDDPNDNTEVNFGGTAPYMQRYWQYHYGSLMGQANVYL